MDIKSISNNFFFFAGIYKFRKLIFLYTHQFPRDVPQKKGNGRTNLSIQQTDTLTRKNKNQHLTSSTIRE
jgi:hypothetical protein